MPDRRVIYDSEDDDEGFSPLNSPPRGHASHVVTTAENDHKGQTMEDHVGESRSTDPEYFQRIYEEQQKPIANFVPDTLGDTQAENRSSDKLKGSDLKPKNNSSSITDPTLKIEKKRGLGKIGARDIGGLTQVTTPSAPSAKQKDVYDFSISDEEGVPVGPAIMHKERSLMGARTAGKRKRGQESAGLVPAPATAKSSLPQPLTSNEQSTQDQEDELPRPRRKNRKRAQDQSLRPAPDVVDSLVDSTTVNMRSEPPGETSLDRDSLDSAVPGICITEAVSPSRGHPPASFFIDPPDTLTASQKQEYLCLSGESDLNREDDQQQASLPVPKSAQNQGHISASTSISTIAYTTPSRYASSIDPLPILGPLDGCSSSVETSSGRRTKLNKPCPQSSPDELSAHSTATTNRAKRHLSAVDEEDELAQLDSRDFDETGYSRDIVVSKASRRRSGVDQDSVRDTEAEVDTSRARKKPPTKDWNVKTKDADPWDSDQAELHSGRYAPKSSRRKSRVVKEEDEMMQTPEELMPNTCGPGDSSFKTTAETVPTIVSSNQQGPGQLPECIAGVDPEVWAALPDDIQQELISQHQPARTSQASRTRRSGRADETTSSVVPNQAELPQPKKRGRKRKIQEIEEAPGAFHDLAAASEQPEARPSPAPTVTAKRKRGRPKKAEAAPPPSPSEIERSTLATDASELVPVAADDDPNSRYALQDEHSQDFEVSKAYTKRGRKKKMMEVPPVHLHELEEIAHPEEDGGGGPAGSMSKRPAEPSHSPVDTPIVSVEVEDRKALRDISSTVSNRGSKIGLAMDQVADKISTDEAGQQQEVTPEPKVMEVPKSASTTGREQGKVPLRVGLSKKSRIAPLLKVIRK